MNEEDALLRAICDQPEEDTPRVVFADWLDEQGGEVNVAWAELIRVQVAIARDPGPASEPLRARGRELTLTDRAWTHRMGFPDQGIWRDWERGFPLALKDYSSGPWMAEFAAKPPIPLREIEVSDARDDELSDFLRWPGLRLVRDLAVWSNGYVRAGLMALAGCEHLSNLERLRMEGVELTDNSALAFIESPHLAQLSYLRLWRCSVRLSSQVQERMAERFEDWNH